ncbi:MAG: BrnA antitoxin family protein [Giesbergeria sp.]|nr:BrnA antitoxin family protein [Giesbergeria sp.]
MNVKSQNSPKLWVDPDDAPELTQDFFEQGDWKIGEQPVSAQEGAAALRGALSRGRPKAQGTKQALTVSYDAEVIDAFKATGTGWQTRMNDALKDWLRTHSPA